MLTNFLPYIISWNTTWRCNLRCAHCYLDADSGEQSIGELTTKEGFRLIDEIACVNSETMLILTGGEPLLRSDIFELSAHASSKGMMVVLGTNGNLVNEDVVQKLKKCGVSGVGISLDSINPDIHDSFRGVRGAWNETIKGIEACKKYGLDFQIQTTVTRSNYTEIPQIIEYAKSLGARVFNLFFLVCTGRGQNITDITENQYEETLLYLTKIQHGLASNPFDRMIIRARCAPIYRRILYQNNPETPLLKTDASSCLAGTHYCRITPQGDVTPCPYMPVSIGNVKKCSFVDIWEKSEHFKMFRNPLLKGKCGICEFRLICGGCRARAYASSGDYMDEDDWCLYEPSVGAGLVPALSYSQPQEGQPQGLPLLWTKEAEERIKKIPFFIRSKIKNAIEQYARKINCQLITPNVLEEIKEKILRR
ncbi:MAG TPA: radical SAM protein [Candidatus Brocadiia bacterium]|nr:radical SAM protein [Planctomycetota bacterium]